MLTAPEAICCFTQISGPPLPLPDEVNPDKLSLALEPESAALYSQENVGDQIASDPSAAAIGHPTNYMVIDIGGGTVDITAHIEVDGGIVVENIPTGNAWGGTQVNEAFSKMLQHIVNDLEFKKFLDTEGRSQRMAALNNIFYNEFEKQKILFGQRKTQEIAISLPKMFVKFYEKVLEKGAEKMLGVEYDEDANDTLYIDKEVVERQLFGPALDGIIKCTLEAIEENEYKVNTFYLVGGFGGCQYVHEKVSAAIERVYSSKGQSCTVLLPVSPELAVAIGAAMWRKNPEKFISRRSDATYGVGATNYPFDPKEHEVHYKRYNEERKVHYCDSIFSLFSKKGEMIDATVVITNNFIPNCHSQKQAMIPIYSTPNVGIKYTKDKNGRRIVTEIGQLVLDIPNPDNLPLRERLLDITMDFSGTEIQAKAKYCVTREEVKTVCDFLFTQ